MRWQALARTSAVLYLAPILAVWCYLYVRSNLLDTATPGYWPAAIAAPATIMAFTVPATALAAAWEGARHRRISAVLAASARHPLGVAARALIPAILVALVGMAVSLGSFFPRAWTAPGHPTLRLLAVYASIHVGYAALGYTLGRLVPVALSLPITLLGSFWCIAFPAAFSPMWIGNVDGGRLSQCCFSLDQVPDRGALIAPVLLAAGMIGAWAVITGWRRPARWSVSVAGGILALALALSITTVYTSDPNAGAHASEPRSTSVLTCSGMGPTICIWPEQGPDSATIRAGASTAWHNLEAAGVPMPTTMSTSSSDGRQGHLPALIMDATPTSDEVIAGVAQGLVPATVPDCAKKDPRSWTGSSMMYPLQFWAALTAGLTPQQIGSSPGLSAAEQVRRYPAAVQAAWFRYNLAALHTCGIPTKNPDQFTGQLAGGTG